MVRFCSRDEVDCAHRFDYALVAINSFHGGTIPGTKIRAFVTAHLLSFSFL